MLKFSYIVVYVRYLIKVLVVQGCLELNFKNIYRKFF